MASEARAEVANLEQRAEDLKPRAKKKPRRPGPRAAPQEAVGPCGRALQNRGARGSSFLEYFRRTPPIFGRRMEGRPKQSDGAMCLAGAGAARDRMPVGK